MQGRGDAVSLKSDTEPMIASVVAALQVASGKQERAEGIMDESAEDLSRRISALEISSRKEAAHEEVLLGMQRQLDCLQKKKACA